MGTSKFYAFEGKTATIDGVTKSWADWCAEKKIPRKTVYGRMRKGLSFEEAISRRSFRGSPFWEQKITHDGMTLTASQWAHRNGISSPCFFHRVKSIGMTPEEAVLTPVGRHGFTPDDIDLDSGIGKTFIEKELAIHPTPEVIEMCTNCKYPDCTKTIVRCLRDKRRKVKKDD